MAGRTVSPRKSSPAAQRFARYIRPRKQVLDFPGLTIDLAQSLALLDGRVLDLTQLEFQVLVRLARNPGWPFTSEKLFFLSLGEKSVDTRTVAVHINRLRKKAGAKR